MTTKTRINSHLDESVAAQIAAPPGRQNKPAPAYARVKGTYDLDQDTIDEIKEIAEELDVPVYAVVQKMLDYALTQYQMDNLKLTRKPVITTWSLE